MTSEQEKHTFASMRQSSKDGNRRGNNANAESVQVHFGHIKMFIANNSFNNYFLVDEAGKSYEKINVW